MPGVGLRGGEVGIIFLCLEGDSLTVSICVLSETTFYPYSNTYPISESF